MKYSPNYFTWLPRILQHLRVKLYIQALMTSLHRHHQTPHHHLSWQVSPSWSHLETIVFHRLLYFPKILSFSIQQLLTHISGPRLDLLQNFLFSAKGLGQLLLVKSY